MNFRRSLIGMVASGLATIAAAGCELGIVTKTEYSEVMQEKGRVVDTMYSKGFHKSSADLVPSYDMGSGEFGFDLVDTSVDVPESWGVVFRCEHENKFAIQGSKPKYKELWEKLDPGMAVTIDYKEVLRNTYEDKDGDGERELTESKLVDYDFIDANPVLKAEKE